MHGPLPQRGSPPEWVVWDDPSRCPYLPGETARLPLRLPARRLRPAELDQRLAAGDRRQGLLLYRPCCPSCAACEALRIDVRTFQPNRTQRRVFRRGEALVETEIGRTAVSAEKVALYNRHKTERGLLYGGPIDEEGYQEFLVESCADSFELRYRVAGRLAGVAVTDRGAQALSAVYCYYDPDRAGLSLGTYSILKQAALARTWDLRYLYLGLRVNACAALSYKANFLPHERLVDGAWVSFR